MKSSLTNWYCRKSNHSGYKLSEINGRFIEEGKGYLWVDLSTCVFDCLITKGFWVTKSYLKISKKVSVFTTYLWCVWW